MRHLLLPLLVVLFCSGEQVNTEESTWQSNLSGLTIGVSYEGFSRAVVDCGRDQAAFVISMDEEFHGVVYTRGSYSNKNTACFRDAKGTKDFALKFPYDDCGMKLDEEGINYVTTVIVQHDDDLIFPGDLAFKISCKKEQGDEELELSRITLADADPGAGAPSPDAPLYYAASNTPVASLLPPHPLDHNEL